MEEFKQYLKDLYLLFCNYPFKKFCVCSNLASTQVIFENWIQYMYLEN